MSKETQKSGAARDALMKYKEQWEHVASNGHVLLARVDAYKHKAKPAFYLLTASLAIAVASVFAASYTASAIAKPFAWLGNKFESTPDAPKASLAPMLSAINPRIPREVTGDDVANIPPADTIAGALKVAAENIKTGAPIKGCAEGKITDAWGATGDFSPRCRYSSDKSRTWVWGTAAANGGFSPFFALVRKDEKGAVTVSNIAVNGVMPVGNNPSLDVRFVPRAVAADFPELATK